jgi:hypothetical protein
MRITKQHKIEQYDTLIKRNDLLSYYLWDKEAKRAPDAMAIEGQWRATAYRLTGANGGYVVTCPKGGTPDIHYLDELIQRYEGDSHENTLELRICIERIRVARHQLFQAA